VRGRHLLLRAVLIRPGEKGMTVHLSRSTSSQPHEIANHLKCQWTRPKRLGESGVVAWSDDDAPADAIPNEGATKLASMLAGQEVEPLSGNVLFTGAIRNGIVREDVMGMPEGEA